MTRGEMLGKMLVLATTGHAGQFDKGGKPYILHPLAVMNILNTDDEELQCIALGHDLIEDTNATYQDLRDAGMTERVIDGIRRMTKQPGQTLDEYKAVIFESVDAMLVKQADLTHNSDIRRLKGVSEKDIQRMAKYHRFYLEIRQRLEEKK
jgi:guanosine-3',5'-bis(diphosphate) 3'-pyrophosphohydrolase